VQKVHERAIGVISIHFSTQLPELIHPSHKAGRLWMQHRYFKSFFEASPMKKTKNKSKNTRKVNGNAGSAGVRQPFHANETPILSQGSTNWHVSV